MECNAKWKNFDGAWMIVTGHEIGVNDTVKTLRNDGSKQYVRVIELLFSDGSHKYWRPGVSCDEMTEKQSSELKRLAEEYPEYADNIYRQINAGMSVTDASNLIGYVRTNYS